jgi:hypothetical protein
MFHTILDKHLPSRRSGGRKKVPRAVEVTLDMQILDVFIWLGDPSEDSNPSEDGDLDKPLQDLLYFGSGYSAVPLVALSLRRSGIWLDDGRRHGRPQDVPDIPRHVSRYRIVWRSQGAIFRCRPEISLESRLVLARMGSVDRRMHSGSWEGSRMKNRGSVVSVSVTRVLPHPARTYSLLACP